MLENTLECINVKAVHLNIHNCEAISNQNIIVNFGGNGNKIKQAKDDNYS